MKFETEVSYKNIDILKSEWMHTHESYYKFLTFNLHDVIILWDECMHKINALKLSPYEKESWDGFKLSVFSLLYIYLPLICTYFLF